MNGSAGPRWRSGMIWCWRARERCVARKDDCSTRLRWKRVGHQRRTQQAHHGPEWLKPLAGARRARPQRLGCSGLGSGVLVGRVLGGALAARWLGSSQHARGDAGRWLHVVLARPGQAFVRGHAAAVGPALFWAGTAAAMVHAGEWHAGLRLGQAHQAKPAPHKRNHHGQRHRCMHCSAKRATRKRTPAARHHHQD